MIAQFMRNEECRERLREPRDMLGDIDQRHRKIARRMQHRKAERADQHHVAGGGLVALPEQDGPGEQAERENDGDDGVKNPELLEVEKAAPPRVHFALDRRIEALVFAPQPAERPHQRHVAHHVGHFAVDDGRLAGKVVMQRTPGGSEPEHQAHHDTGNDGEAAGHRDAHGCHQRDRRDRGGAGREHVPDKHVFAGEHGV